MIDVISSSLTTMEIENAFLIVGKDEERNDNNKMMVSEMLYKKIVSAQPTIKESGAITT